MDGENLKELTVADVLRLVPENKTDEIGARVRDEIALQHGEEDSHTGIVSEITEWGTKELFVEAYGWRKLAKMKVERMWPELVGDMPALRIVYETFTV